VRGLERFTPADVEELTAADLTVAGLDDPRVRLWLLRDASGVLVGSTGFEISAGGDDVIVRSVAVALATTQQVRLFVSTGQLAREIAWRRELDTAGGGAAAPA